MATKKTSVARPHIQSESGKTPVTRRGIPNFDIAGVFESFGYTPSQEDIDMLIPAFSGKYDAGITGTTAVANYVNAIKMEEERRANDPLAKLVEEQRTRTAELETEASGLYDQLKGIIEKSPKLFGSLSEEQIDQYLAPIKQASLETSARVEGAMGRRGLAGSSIEAGALSEQNRLFQQQALASGLQVGLSQQEQQARAVQQRLSDVYGRAGLLTQLGSAGTGQISTQNLGQSQYLSQLPIYLQELANQRNASLEAARGGGTDWASVGSLAGGVIGAVGGAFSGNPLMGYGIGSSIGGSIGGAAGGNSAAGASYGQSLPYWALLNQLRGNSIPTTAQGQNSEWYGLV